MSDANPPAAGSLFKRQELGLFSAATANLQPGVARSASNGSLRSSHSFVDSPELQRFRQENQDQTSLNSKLAKALHAAQPESSDVTTKSQVALGDALDMLEKERNSALEVKEELKLVESWFQQEQAARREFSAGVNLIVERLQSVVPSVVSPGIADVPIRTRGARQSYERGLTLRTKYLSSDQSDLPLDVVEYSPGKITDQCKSVAEDLGRALAQLRERQSQQLSELDRINRAELSSLRETAKQLEEAAESARQRNLELTQQLTDAQHSLEETRAELEQTRKESSTHQQQLRELLPGHSGDYGSVQELAAEMAEAKTFLSRAQQSVDHVRTWMNQSHTAETQLGHTLAKAEISGRDHLSLTERTPVNRARVTNPRRALLPI